MPLTSGSALLQKTAEKFFWNSFNSIADPMANLVAVRQSTQKTDTNTWLGAAPMPQEWKGAKQAKTVPEQSLTITNTPFEATVKVDKELIKYQQWDEIGKLLSNLGEKARAHQSKLHTEDLENNTANGCYDTLEFFDTLHVDQGAAYTPVHDNALTAANTLDIAPTDLQWATALRAMITKIWAAKDDQGDPFIAPTDNPADWIIMVPPGLRAVANRVHRVADLTGSVSNDMQGFGTVRTNQHMANAERLFLFYVGGTQHRPLVRQEVQGIQLEDTMEGDEKFQTGDISYSVTWWGKTDYGQYRTAVQYIFTTA